MFVSECIKVLFYHCRLQDGVGMESLPSAILLHIFSYLDPQSLGRCSQVCPSPPGFVLCVLCVIVTHKLLAAV